MSKNNLYDVIIIGAGPSGIFCAYELIRQNLQAPEHFPTESFHCLQM